MNKISLEKFKNFDYGLISLIFLSLLGCIFFVGHYNGIMIDFGRELYYPEMILKGKVLYKDLFNIYGPFSYLMNAFFYNIFGAKLQTLYILGSILGTLFVTGVYSVARKFLDNFTSFLIGLFTIILGITTTIIFNFTFPYSWAMLYGIIFFIWSLYFLLKSEKNILFALLASVFAGFAVVNKYEFILYGIFIITLIIKFEFKNLKNLLILLSGFLLPFVLSFGILFLQGLKFHDLIDSFAILKIMTHTQTLKYFYHHVGILYSNQLLLVGIVALLKASIIFGLIYLCVKLWGKNKVISGLFLSVILVLISIFVIQPIQNILMFLPILILCLTLKNIKKLDKSVIILIIAILSVSAKSFWALLIMSYGSYYAPILLIAVFSLLKNKKIKISAEILLGLIIICLLNLQIKDFNACKNLILFNGNKIFTTKEVQLSTNNLITFINQNTKLVDKTVIFPEGMTINFLVQRPSDDFYNSLLPLYIETFGENKITNYYKKNKPEYIIFTNENMSNYGFNYICEDYALDFCSFVSENYKNINIIGNEKRFLIYKRK